MTGPWAFDGVTHSALAHRPGPPDVGTPDPDAIDENVAGILHWTPDVPPEPAAVGILETLERRDGNTVPPDFPDGKFWYAVHTRSRHEKKVAHLLGKSNIERFLPLRRVLSQWADRKKWVEKPCFSGYLFVRIRPEEAYAVNSTRGVVGLVSARPGVPAIVPERDIENVLRLVESQVQVDPYPYLKPGQTVCIRRGPLRGIEGILVRKNKRHFLVVSVALLGQSVIVEVPAESVQGL